MDALIFKRCTVADLDQLIHVSKSTFADAFEKLNTPEDFKLYTDKAFNKSQIQKELVNPNSHFYFVYLENNLAGYFKINFNEAQNEQFNVPTIELERIYVVKDFQNKNIGNNILKEVLSIAQNHNTVFIWLGVWEENKKAIAFYKRHGFVVFGSHDFMLGTDLQTDILMRYYL